MTSNRTNSRAAQEASANGARSFAFGPFLLIPERQLLLQDGDAVRIGCRALDLLTALAERPGELVTKDELMERAWPTTTVDQGNLKVNMAALRRALDDCSDNARYIATVTGRGYRFVAPVETRGPADARPFALASPHGPSFGATQVFEAPDAALGAAMPALFGRPLDPAAQAFVQQSREQGMRIHFVDLPPDAAFPAEARTQPAERFEPVDYGIVIDGEIALILEETTVLLKPGSMVVQRGTGHSWTNLSSRPSRMLVVRFDGQPQRSGAAMLAQS